MTYLELAKKMKTFRENAFITQFEVARALAITLPTYKRIENGLQEPNFHQLQMICTYFKFDPKEVLTPEKKPISQFHYD